MIRYTVYAGVLLLSVIYGRDGTAGAIQTWLTTGDQTNLLARKPDLSFHSGSATGTTITVNDKVHYQTMSGFGAALTDASAWLIANRLTTTQRNALMTSLFSPSAGIGISYLRLPMGSSDYSKTIYTYDDMPAGQIDPNLTNFSIAHDQAAIIPELQQALALNPNLKIMASPWSPPAWMKTNGGLNGGSLKTAYYQAYANYFVKFVQAYNAAGVSIDTVTVQNEPLNSTNSYPSMAMSATEQANFIKNYLGPAFAAVSIQTKIVAYDHNWDNTSFATTVFNDPGASPYVAGSAWHAYAGNPSAQTTVHNAFPTKDIYFTEITGGTWATNFASNLDWNYHNIFLGAPRNWAKTALMWNLALDENNGPTIGGAANARGVVTIHEATGTVDRNVEFYAIGQSSKFVEPGAARIDSTSFSGLLESVAYLNPDGTEALLVLNPTGNSRLFDVSYSNQQFSYTLPPNSVVTFDWQGVPEPETLVLFAIGALGLWVGQIWRKHRQRYRNISARIPVSCIIRTAI